MKPKHDMTEHYRALGLKHCGWTLEEIGAELGKSRERVRQMIAKAEFEICAAKWITRLESNQRHSCFKDRAGCQQPTGE